MMNILFQMIVLSTLIIIAVPSQDLSDALATQALEQAQIRQQDHYIAQYNKYADIVGRGGIWKGE